ncbi:hypothetical protein SAMN05421821_10493 [Mucilaginibacter lappiensis]|uniref:EH_Signature domain-containing protein n=1 Tax=Mucilaginibacter lappiensis TaxID=354630 RepID=A0ABR6PID3_9SPHI|nr:contractile injection system tape measure protein [Mucilaginibacter lappiensis]MBB6109495.1 hypothetical protein [Mucilaginibacter lappiensis]SIQ93099.1 hypothetical protein SAMN05421821_10493 [Mucilaginibacter lappiensis]
MATHIVHKQQVNLNLPKREEAHAYQNRVSDLLRNELSASMEAVFDEMFPTTDIIRIDSLHLFLDKIETHNFEQEFKTHFIEELRKSLSSKKSKLKDEYNEEVLSPEQSFIKAFIYFLENGYLPWYSTVENMANWSNEILNAFSENKNQYFFNWLRDNYADKPIILQRLVLQFDNAFLEKVLSIVAPLPDESWGDIYNDLETLTSNFIKKRSPVRDKVWQHIFQLVLNDSFLENHLISSNKKDSEWLFYTLSLLAGHFNLSDRDIAALSKNQVNKQLKTNIVKKAFKKLLSHLATQTDFGEDIDESKPGSQNEEAWLNNVLGNSEEISTNKEKHAEKKRPENTDPISSQKNKIKTKNKDALVNGNMLLENNDPKKPHVNTSENSAGKQETTQTEHTPNTTKDGVFLNPQENAEERRRGSDMAGSDKKENTNKAKQSPFQNKTLKGITETETLYVKGSGIVILHYFLSPYFADLELLANGKFKNDTAHQRAVLLLYYLTTGKSKAAEFNLTLSKILCGYPITETLSAAIILTRKEKTESKRLLEAIIDYWTPLKNTSIKGLQNAFFERDGKLTKKENGWLLTVEQKTIDVLLGKLPWGYSTIKLPWMQEILNVDWY